MKYIYYVVAIVMFFSGLAIYGLLDVRLDVSEPVLSVNDRIYSKAEISKFLEDEPSDIDKEEFFNSLIEQQLLIQEAIAQKINEEESFREAVEIFYEQSLIKILLERKQESLVVDVSTEEVAKYEALMDKHLVISKMRMAGGQGSSKMSMMLVETIERPFIDLSDDLQFIVMGLDKGDSTDPQSYGGQGLIVYRLDDISTIKKAGKSSGNDFDVKEVSLFIRDKKKEQILEDWIKNLRESADIWREK